MSLSDWELYEVGGMDALQRRYEARFYLFATFLAIAALISIVEFIKQSPMLLLTCQVGSGIGLAVGSAATLYYGALAVRDLCLWSVGTVKSMLETAKHCHQAIQNFFVTNPLRSSNEYTAHVNADDLLGRSNPNLLVDYGGNAQVAQTAIEGEPRQSAHMYHYRRRS